MAWPRDVVAEQAQSAPLFYHFPSSLIRKRSFVVEDLELNAKRKKCESRLNLTSGHNEEMRRIQMDRGIPAYTSSQTERRKPLTACLLCDLHFQTELDLEEHLYSLLHHRALDTEKGKDFIHECNLCCIRCRGLAEYVSHLREEEHRKNVEKRKEDLENNRLSDRVFGLAKYKNTFMCEPKKSIHTRENSLLEKSETLSSVISTKKLPAKTTNDEYFSLPKNYSSAAEKSKKVPFSSEDHLRYSQLESSQNKTTYNPQPNSITFQNGENEAKKNSLDRSADDFKGSSFHQRFLSNPDFFKSDLNSPGYTNFSRSIRDNDANMASYTDRGNMRKSNHLLVDFDAAHPNCSREDPPLYFRQSAPGLNQMNDKTEGSSGLLPTPSSGFDVNQHMKTKQLANNRYKSPLLKTAQDPILQKWKKILRQNKKKEKAKNLKSPGKDSNKNKSPTIRTKNRKPLIARGLSSSQSSDVKSGTNTENSFKTPSTSDNFRTQSKSSRKPIKSASGVAINKKDLSRPLNFSQRNSASPSNTTEPSLKLGAFNSAFPTNRSNNTGKLPSTRNSTEAPIKNFNHSRNIPPLQVTSSRSSSSVSLGHMDREELRRKFRQIMEEVNPPSCSVSSSTIDSTTPSGGSSACKLAPDLTSNKPTINRNSTNTTSIKTLKNLSQPHKEYQPDNLLRSRLCDSQLVGDLEDESLDEAVTSTDDVTSSDKQTAFESTSYSGFKSSEQSQPETVNFPNEVVSASRVREKLENLARKKEQELKRKPNNSPTSCDDTSIVTSSQTSLEEAVGQDNPIEKVSDSKADEVKKRKKAPVMPNLSQARRRPKYSDGNSAEAEANREKQMRIAKYRQMVEAPTMPRLPGLAPSSTKSTQQKKVGPRFGVDLKPRVKQQSLSLDDKEAEDIVSTIREFEDSPESPVTSKKRPRSMSEGENTSDFPVKSHQRGVAENTVKSIRKSGNCSSRVLDMSEEEARLLSVEEQIKESSAQLKQELAQLNKLIADLEKKKREVEEDLKVKNNDQKMIKKRVAGIRKKRLSILRKDVHSSYPDPTSTSDTPHFRPDSCSHSTPTPTSRPDLSSTQNTSLCNSTPRPSSYSITDYQSPIAQPSFKSASGNESKYHTAASPTRLDTSPNFTRKSDLSSNVKVMNIPERVASPLLETTKTEKDATPFPVSSGSVYFDSHSNAAGPNAMSASINAVLKKYGLKEKSFNTSNNEREVTSTTPPKTYSPLNISSAYSVPSDPGVTSSKNTPDTKPSSANLREALRVYGKNSGVGDSPGGLNVSSTERKKPLVLRDLNSRKSSLSDNTSQVNGRERILYPQSPESISSGDRVMPVDLTKEESTAAMLGCKTISHHTDAVVGIFVTNCQKIITFSKDKTLGIFNIKTGQLLCSHNLPAVPHHCHISMSSNPGQSRELKFSTLSFFVAFADDSRGKNNSLTKTSLQNIQINLPILPDTSSLSYRLKINKLIDYDCLILALHQSNDLLYLGGRDGKVAIFDVKTLKVKDVLDCHSPRAICCLTTGREGARRILCCGSSDCRVSIRDANDGLLIKMLTGHTKTVNCLQVKNGLLYSGSADRTVLVHDINTGSAVQRFMGMHGNSIKALHVHDSVVITLCLDKAIRVLKNEPSRISGSPKSLAGIPLCMHVHMNRVEGSYNSSTLYVASVYVGCMDGKVQVIPLTQLAYRDQSQKSISSPPGIYDGDASSLDASMQTNQEFLVTNLVKGLNCMWNGCDATGFTNRIALTDHINLFHATDDFKETLNRCCHWGQCSHYFSTDLDTPLDIDLHMDTHVHEAVMDLQRR